MSSNDTHMDRAVNPVYFRLNVFTSTEQMTKALINNHYFHSLFSCYVKQIQKGGDLKYLPLFLSFKVKPLQC